METRPSFRHLGVLSGKGLSCQIKQPYHILTFLFNKLLIAYNKFITCHEWTGNFNEANFKDASLAQWWEKHLLKCSLIKLTSSWCNTMSTPEQKTSKNILTYIGLILKFCIIRVKYHSEIKATSVWPWLFNMDWPKRWVAK